MSECFAGLKNMKVVEGVTPDNLPFDLMNAGQPFIMRQLVSEWPLVKAALKSNETITSYIKPFYKDGEIGAFVNPKQNAGRYFYNQDMSGFNFTKKRANFGHILDELYPNKGDENDYYVGSANIDTLLPGLKSANPLSGLNDVEPLTSIWIGSHSRIAAHHDHPQNIACCVAGRRRFILFPPEQIKNLYIGPLDFSPAGQAISLVDFHHPDSEQFPLFEEAMKHAFIAELEPGDAIFIPSLWWHHVEGLSDLNILMNYWWEPSDLSIGAPMDALLHSIVNIRHLTGPQKDAWRSLFEHYVFSQNEQTFEHIPKSRQGLFGKDYKTVARQVRSFLLNQLNR